MAIRHWSYSALRQYQECPLRFFFQRILSLPEKSQSANLLVGSAVHAALAEYHRDIQQNRLTETAKLHNVITDTWAEREKKAPVTYKDGDTRDDCIAKAITLIETYLKEPPPTNIIGIEQEIIASIANSQGEYLATPLMAVLDLITETHDEVTVQEFKTSSRAYSESEAELSLQPTCYATAVKEITGAIPKVEYTVLVKTKTPKVQRLTTIRNDDDLGRLGDLIQTVERAIEHDVFYPIETPLHCFGCPYRQPCRTLGRTEETSRRAA
ncbi:hypothetical protein BH11PLA2_BH11PLA2_38360 [soil metagenome]